MLLAHSEIFRILNAGRDATTVLVTGHRLLLRGFQEKDGTLLCASDRRAMIIMSLYSSKALGALRCFFHDTVHCYIEYSTVAYF